jgi:hypothetical protein
MFIMKYLSFIAALVFIVVPTVSSAAGFIPCDGSNANGGIACTECHFVQMGNTILKWLIGVLFAVFAVVAAMGGFGLVTSGGNQQALDDAKAKLQNALIGIIIVLAAWLLVDTVMRGLLSSGTDEIKGYGPWSEVKCGTVATSIAPIPGTGFPPTPVGAFFYEFYAEDAVKKCKVPHSGSGSDLADCSAKQTADLNSVAGNKYMVENCDPDVYPPTPPAWSTLPACGAPASSACTPLVKMTDPLALKMEGGQTVMWDKTDSRLQACANKLGGNVQSAYRPPQYQSHLKEIHTKHCTQDLSGCAAIKADVAAEFAKHGLNCKWPVAVNSNHSIGLAVDIKGAAQSDAVAKLSCFDWYGAGDPVHYTLLPNCTCK